MLPVGLSSMYVDLFRGKDVDENRACSLVDPLADFCVNVSLVLLWNFSNALSSLLL